jgi:hypothetical protein
MPPRYALLLALLLAAPAQAQVPSFQEVTGHAFGERITQTFQAQRYLERLAEASDRVTVEQIGESAGGRPLMLAVVTAPENHARLDQIRRTAQRLGDPRGLSPAERGSLAPPGPARHRLVRRLHPRVRALGHGGRC